MIFVLCHPHKIFSKKRIVISNAKNVYKNYNNILLTKGTPTVAAGNAGVGPIDCPDDYIVLGGNRLCGGRFNDGSEPAMSENTKILGKLYQIHILLCKF